MDYRSCEPALFKNYPLLSLRLPLDKHQLGNARRYRLQAHGVLRRSAYRLTPDYHADHFAKRRKGFAADTG